MSTLKIGISEVLGGGVKRIQLVHKYEDIISLENLCLAWEEFVKGKKKQAGVSDFRRNLMDNIIALYEDLANKTYIHGTYKERHIWDPKHRLIHVAPVRDRLLHHAIYRILYPFFDRTFIGDSYSCRNDKGVHRALNRFRALFYKVSRNNTRTCWVLKCDVRKFFASVDHEILLGILQEYIPGQNVMWLLGQVINSFSSKERCTIYFRSEIDGTQGIHRIGLPLGNLTSQLFGNLYLNELDRFVKHRLCKNSVILNGAKRSEESRDPFDRLRAGSSSASGGLRMTERIDYIRYADDFVFLHESREFLEEQIPKIAQFLQERMHLELHPHKVTISTFSSGVDFLGWVHFPDHRVLRGTTKRRMMRRLKECEKEETLRSYLGLLSHGNTRKLQQEVLKEQWLGSG